VFPVHLQRSAVVAIRDCPDRGQFIGPRSLKQAALQWIWHFQEPLDKALTVLVTSVNLWFPATIRGNPPFPQAGCRATPRTTHPPLPEIQAPPAAHP
jgi:hypothetical protein